MNMYIENFDSTIFHFIQFPKKLIYLRYNKIDNHHSRYEK